MCTQLLTAQMADTSASSDAQIQSGGDAQAAAVGVRALGDLAAGVTRARMARADAASERAAAAKRAQRIRTAGESELSRARAAATGVGVSVASGSVLEAERQIVRNVEQDAGVAILTGSNRAASLEASAGYYRAAGLNQALDGALSAGDKWKRSRRATVDYGAILSSTAARQYNPAGDGFTTDPMGGA